MLFWEGTVVFIPRPAQDYSIYRWSILGRTRNSSHNQPILLITSVSKYTNRYLTAVNILIHIKIILVPYKKNTHL